VTPIDFLLSVVCFLLLFLMLFLDSGFWCIDRSNGNCISPRTASNPATLDTYKMDVFKGRNMHELNHTEREKDLALIAIPRRHSGLESGHY
jgi:hypothetical protein